MAASLSPTVWRRTGAGEYARARPPPAVPEVFRTHRSAFRRLTLPDRFPTRAFPANEISQPPAVPVCSAGNAAVGFKCADRKRFSDSSPKRILASHRTDALTVLFADRHSACTLSETAGRPTEKEGRSEPLPSFRAPQPPRSPAFGPTAGGRLHGWSICTSIFPLVFSNSATQRLIYCSISLLADRPSDSAI